MLSKFLKIDLELCPGLEPRQIIIDIARRFNFRDISFGDIERVEYFGKIRARVANLAEGMDAEATLEEGATSQGYTASLCSYAGPVIGFLDGKRQIVRAELSAYVLISICRERIVRAAERHGYTSTWWPFEDSR